MQPAYWESRRLDYLWQRIGACLRQRPRIRYLCGRVSLGAVLPLEAREWIVHYHRHYFGDIEQLAQARNPVVMSAAVANEATAAWIGRPSDAGLAILRARLQVLNAQLPVLYRQYAGFCEPAGVRFLDFGVDPAFGGCIDGLARIDLRQLRPTKHARYLGAGGANRRRSTH